jgi:hypothetical protein
LFNDNGVMTLVGSLLAVDRTYRECVHSSKRPKEMRARADECERLAQSLTPTPDHLGKMLRDIADQWRRLADDAEAHPKSSMLVTTGM